MLIDKNLCLRKVTESDFPSLWSLLNSNTDWRAYNGPYFPQRDRSPDEFRSGLFAQLLAGDRALAIELDKKVVGTVSYYWECQPTRWLEAGIIIYQANLWGGNIGRRSLQLWFTHLFETLEIERVGLTTWSGNLGMMKCAEALGMVLEARMRKCRYYQGIYYDSIRYGVLREEWYNRGSSQERECLQ